MIKANRTTTMLLPFYSNFGKEFITVFEQMIGKGAVNIQLYLGDVNYNKKFKNLMDCLDENLIFVQILEKPFNFDRLLLHVQSHANFITSYESGLTDILVFKLNDPFDVALKQLKYSKYSKMYDKNLVDKLYPSTKDWYIIYVDDHQVVRFPQYINSSKKASINYLIDKWDNIEAKNFFNKLIISPYHVFKKSEELKELLEHIYNANIPVENELVEKIKLKQEILNYE